MTVDEAISAFLEHRHDRVEESSLKTYDFWLHRWSAWRSKRRFSPELSAVTLDELKKYFRSMSYQELAPASKDATWRVLKALWRLLDRRGHITPEQQSFFGPDGLAQPRIPDEIRPIYEQTTLDKLIAACESCDPEQESRNRAIILLLWESGMRAGELCSLTDDKTDLARRRAVIDGKSDGKGKRQRWVYWDEPGATELARYIGHRRGQAGGKLFRNLKDGSGLTSQAIRLMLKRAAKRAGVTLIKGGPVHSIRRTFAHETLDAGAGDLELQQLLGHASIVSTTRYTRKNPEQLQKVYQRTRRKRG